MSKPREPPTHHSHGTMGPRFSPWTQGKVKPCPGIALTVPLWCLLFRRAGRSRLTEVGVTGLAAIAAPGVRRGARCPRSGVQGTGFGNGCHQVLVVSVPPAPPADLGLAAACDHRPVAHVSAGTQSLAEPPGAWGWPGAHSLCTATPELLLDAAAALLQQLLCLQH